MCDLCDRSEDSFTILSQQPLPFHHAALECSIDLTWIVCLGALGVLVALGLEVSQVGWSTLQRGWRDIEWASYPRMPPPLHPPVQLLLPSSHPSMNSPRHW